jgi:hypothetical protein
MPVSSNVTAPFLAQASASLSRSDLRWEFANIAAAVALLAVALAAIALFCLRPRTRDLTLVYLGLLCSLYAVRMLVYDQSFRSIVDDSRMSWSYVGWVITCIIILPGLLFLYQVVGERLRAFIRWLLAANAAFAVFGILAAAAGVSLATLGVAYTGSCY